MERNNLFSDYYKRPFVLWTCALILGLVLNNIVTANFFWYAIPSFLIFMLLLAFVFKKLPLERIFYATFFIVLGWILMDVSKPSKEQLFDGETYYYGQVRELRKNEDWSTILVELNAFENDSTWVRCDASCVLTSKGKNSQIESGDDIVFKSRMQRIQNKNNPGEYNVENYWFSKGVAYQGFGIESGILLMNTENRSSYKIWTSKIATYSYNVFSTFLAPEAAGLMQAMLLGDKSKLDTEVRASFQNVGGMHLLAVSGLHVGIISYLLPFLFKLLFGQKHRKLIIILVALSLWGYAFLVGMSPSVVRAVVMFSLLILSEVFTRRNDALNVLFLTAMINLLINPLQLYDLGFQLSYLAMAGIFMFYETIEHVFFINRKWIRWIWQGIAIGLAAQLLTIPIILFQFHQFPNYFILTNVIILLFGAGLIFSGIAVLTFSKVPILNWLTGGLLLVIVSVFMWLINGIENLPFAVAKGFNPTIGWVISCYFLVITWSLVKSKWRLFQWSGTVVLLIFLQFGRWKNLSQREVVVMNHYNPVILLNDSGNQHCFILKDEHFDKAERLVNDYQKIYPGSCQYHSLQEKKFSVNSSQGATMNLVYETGKIVFSINDQTYNVRLNNFENLDNLQNVISLNTKFPSDLNVPFMVTWD